jgi:hypothetical protein
MQIDKDAPRRDSPPRKRSIVDRGRVLMKRASVAALFIAIATIVLGFLAFVPQATAAGRQLASTPNPHCPPPRPKPIPTSTSSSSGPKPPKN